MELTIALAISILSIVFTILNFAVSRKDKAVKDTKDEKSSQVLIDYRLNQLEKKIDQILSKLDTQESEIRRIVNEEIDKHIAIYHKGETK